MKKDMPLEGLRWSRDSGSALYDTPQTAVLGRAGGGQDIAERQLGDSYSIWQKLHKPKFSSFEEFLKYCNNSGEYNGKK